MEKTNFPDGWSRDELGKLVKFSSGGTPSKEVPEYWNGDIPWITAKDMKTFELRGSEIMITLDGLKHGGRTVPEKSILILVRGMTLMKDVPIGLTTREIAFNQDVRGLQVKGQMEPRFLAYALVGQKETLLGLVDIAGHGTGRLSSEVLAEHPISYPENIAEQTAIAAVLSAWDRAIEQTTALIAAKERLKQGLMQQLLTGKRRFKEFSKPWEKKSFSAFMTESRVRGSNGDEARKLTVKLYGKGVVPKSEARVGSQSTQYYRRSTGQFIYSKLDFLNGAFGIVPSVLDGYESTLDVPAFDIIEKMDSRWFVAFVSREAFYENHLGLANGGRKARRVNPNDFLAINVPIPEKDEQAKVADAVDTFDREIKLLREVLLATRVQKRALMQKLLTGEVRVTESLLKKGAKL